ncbi:MAG: TetR/AcrR family transcriptional regulator [Pseudomonadota bacterium]
MLSTDERNPQAIATKCLIRDQAEKLFGHFGFSKTSVGDIAKACSMSTGNIYRFFRNKQAVGIAVVENYFDLQAQKMLDARHGTQGTAQTKIRATITAGVRHLVDTMDGNPRLFEMSEFICEDPEGAVILDTHRRFKHQVLSELVAEGVAGGELISDDPARDGWTLLLATTAFWMPQALVAWHDEKLILDDLQDVLKMALAGLGDPPLTPR